ncbi:MAG: pilus biosynthesis protein TadE [Mycobacteriaceae bacterium]|nr:pilus biosynthesis protein TadE [Mycobacteriaceae bacterium]
MVISVLGLGGVTAVSMQVRCIDAAREAARLAARGDERSAIAVALRIAPSGAQVQVRQDHELVIATVIARSKLLPRLSIGAQGVSAAELPR